MATSATGKRTLQWRSCNAGKPEPTNHTGTKPGNTPHCTVQHTQQQPCTDSLPLQGSEGKGTDYRNSRAQPKQIQQGHSNPPGLLDSNLPNGKSKDLLLRLQGS